MSDNKELLDPSQFVPRVSNPETLPALQSHKDLINRSIVADWSTPEFKIKHFIANSHIHPLHKIRQYMIELNARQEAIENFNDEMLKLEAEIELEKENERIRRVYLGISDTVGIDSDMFQWKGKTEGNEYWSATTKGFHMDSGATIAGATSLTGLVGWPVTTTPSWCWEGPANFYIATGSATTVISAVIYYNSGGTLV